jgi:predicted RNase H-like HicB family nuclease
MLTRYLREAMRTATYEILTDSEGFYGCIPQLEGVWANAPTLEECREQLEEVLEDWLLIRLTRQFPIPAIGDVTLSVKPDIGRWSSQVSSRLGGLG